MSCAVRLAHPLTPPSSPQMLFPWLCSSAGVLWRYLSLHSCKSTRGHSQGTQMELHPPHSMPPPGPLDRPGQRCPLPSKAGLPSLLHSPFSFLTCSNHIFTLHPFSSLSLAPCPGMALLDTAEISCMFYLSWLPGSDSFSSYRRSTCMNYSSPGHSSFPSLAYSSSHQMCLYLSFTFSSCAGQPSPSLVPSLCLQSSTLASV